MFGGVTSQYEQMLALTFSGSSTEDSRAYFDEPITPQEAFRNRNQLFATELNDSIVGLPHTHVMDFSMPPSSPDLDLDPLSDISGRTTPSLPGTASLTSVLSLVPDFSELPN
ncbi:hypothetical protein PCE1_003488 [Barthelona sp. PCE]